VSADLRVCAALKLQMRVVALSYLKGLGISRTSGPYLVSRLGKADSTDRRSKVCKYCLTELTVLVDYNSWKVAIKVGTL